MDFDPARAEAFAGRLVSMYSDAGLTFLVDVGHRTGLFEAAAQGPATSQVLAERAGVHERHTREWLGAMVSGGLFTYEPATRTYTLPPEHASLLTGDGAMNLAGMSQFAAFLARHVPAVADTFRDGGGVPYSAYRPEFTELMDRMGRATYDEYLIDAYLPAADGIVDRLREGIRVADLGCGTGHCINLMAASFPASTFIGFDLADDALDAARREAAGMGLSNASFEAADVVDLPTDPPFDLVCAFDAIHDQAEPAAVLDRAFAALRPGGSLLMVEPDASSNLEDNAEHPLGAFMYVASTMHCMQVSLARGGAGLGTAWGRQLAMKMLDEAGFADVTLHETPPSDIANVIFAARRP